MPGNTHAMLAEANHDEAAEQLFIRDLKTHLGRAEGVFAAHLADADYSEDSGPELFQRFNQSSGFRHWLSVRRQSQELLWDLVGTSVERQTDALAEKAEAQPALGSVRLDAPAPRHLQSTDVHLMPGGYDEDDGGFFQGALMDRGGAVYMLGRNGGFLNDRRGHTAAAHLLYRFPDFRPQRLLELGCGIGSSLVPMAGYFPAAESHGLDVGAGILRYARARAAGLGAELHLHQGDAAHAPFEDESFDLVFSCVVLHELEPGTIPAMLKECHRLLRPGGVVLHLEVPQRYDDLSPWQRVRAEVEARYNNEPNWIEATSADYQALLNDAGFRDIEVGYQRATDRAVRGNNGFGAESEGVFNSWAVMSARK